MKFDSDILKTAMMKREHEYSEFFKYLLHKPFVEGSKFDRLFEKDKLTFLNRFKGIHYFIPIKNGPNKEFIRILINKRTKYKISIYSDINSIPTNGTSITSYLELTSNEQKTPVFIPIGVRRDDLLEMLIDPNSSISDSCLDRLCDLVYVYKGDNFGFPILMPDDILLFKQCRDKNDFTEIKLLIELIRLGLG